MVEFSGKFNSSKSYRKMYVKEKFLTNYVITIVCMQMLM